MSNLQSPVRPMPDSTAASVPALLTLSVIVPVLDERNSLTLLIDELKAAVRASVATFEVVLVDDGSTDDSWSVIRTLAASDPAVSGIRLRRNFGKAAALTAGMKVASGALILMLDADLQDDPAEFPSLLAKIHEGFDVVNGWKRKRLDPWHKVYPSRIFNWMIGRLTGLKLHDHNCGLKLFRAEVAREVQIYGELHRFIPVLAHARGFRVTEVAVNHRPRQHGSSKYGVRRFLRGLLDLMTVTFLTSFGRRPQHALGTVGLGFFLLGIAGLSYLGILWMLMQTGIVSPPQPIGNRPLLAYSIAASLLGGQALSLGLLAELIVAYTSRSTDSYSVRETTVRE
jgi:glycosyltransferase involved in cell wall biosynthesis